MIRPTATEILTGRKPASDPLKLPRIEKLDLIKGSNAIADELGVDQATVLKLIRKGDLPAFKVGNAYAIRREMLHGWVQIQELLTIAKRFKGR